MIFVNRKRATNVPKDDNAIFKKSIDITSIG